MKAWELLSKPGAWTQGTWARDYIGLPVDPWNEDARCFCMVGAVYNCQFSIIHDATEKIREKLNLALAVDVFNWNDAPGRTQEEVVAVLKELDI